MIKIKLKPCCNQCDHIELEIFCAKNILKETMTEIDCMHSCVCEKYRSTKAESGD